MLTTVITFHIYVYLTAFQYNRDLHILIFIYNHCNVFLLLFSGTTLTLFLSGSSMHAYHMLKHVISLKIHDIQNHATSRCNIWISSKDKEKSRVYGEGVIAWTDPLSSLHHLLATAVF